jgi:excinuclease ABC subunit B
MAILYADRVTGSMQRAIDETDRRREKQVAYNQAHSITPRGIQKTVTDVMDVGYASASNQRVRRFDKVAEQAREYEQLSVKQLNARLQKLEKRMYDHARNLEFEEAAQVRDDIAAIKERYFRNLPDTIASV